MAKKVAGKKQVQKGASRTVEKQPLRIVLPFKMLALSALALCSVMGGYYAIVNMPAVDFSWHGDEVVEIEAVIVDAPLEQVSENDIRAVILPYMEQDFYGIALAQLQLDLTSLPWVDTAVIKRQWPNKISVTLLEKTVIARWGESQLLTQKGNMFTPERMIKPLLLPELAGPDGMQVRVMELYLELTLLLGNIEPKITRLAVDERYNWTLVLDNDVRLILGNELMVERLRRFVTLYSELKSQPQSIDYVDFRHANGFAVGWKNNKMKNANG
ncbi:Cell division protein FtsQ [Sinobacterium norvegicum]|uniref:Cell division protein FtsQ n=1 Tax=Sinobacterium norvegicum TaxID=1641715 RepID=A0ABM9AJB6_9GAMM|nr:cell division protein FtsQ/DivIB [Sinobacterium norvegicum]CAH0993168.1 Cell division protein FtsQ [Sinobacterium norvegicum]